MKFYGRKAKKKKKPIRVILLSSSFSACWKSIKEKREVKSLLLFIVIYITTITIKKLEHLKTRRCVLVFFLQSASSSSQHKMKQDSAGNNWMGTSQPAIQTDWFIGKVEYWISSSGMNGSLLALHFVCLCFIVQCTFTVQMGHKLDNFQALVFGFS